MPGRNEVILKESIVPIPTAMLSVVTTNSNDLEFSQVFRLEERKWLKMGQLQGKRFSQRLFASCQPLWRECEPWTVASHSRPTPNSKSLSMLSPAFCLPATLMLGPRRWPGSAGLGVAGSLLNVATLKKSPFSAFHSFKLVLNWFVIKDEWLSLAC